MKYILLHVFYFISSLHITAQTRVATDFFPLHIPSTQANYYKMTNGQDYLDFFRDETVVLMGMDYRMRVRLYSWGENDTAYFRESAQGFYSFDRHTGKENLVLPKEVFAGQKWQETDKSWDYEVMSIQGTLTTPVAHYEDLIVVSCVQLTHRDRNKAPTYLMYYGADVGLVGVFSDGKLSSYLAEIKRK